jgi:hypothetical protein
LRKGNDPDLDPYLWLIDPDPGAQGYPTLLYVLVPE